MVAALIAVEWAIAFALCVYAVICAYRRSPDAGAFFIVLPLGAAAIGWPSLRASAAGAVFPLQLILPAVFVVLALVLAAVARGLPGQDYKTGAYDPRKAPPELLEVVQLVTPLLLEGDHPSLQVLREQWKDAAYERFDFTGDGFAACFSYPLGTPRCDGCAFSGGEATLRIRGSESPAHARLTVVDGVISSLVVRIPGNRWPRWGAVQEQQTVRPLEPLSPRT